MPANLQGLKPFALSWFNIAVKTATHKSMAVRCVTIEATAREEKTERANDYARASWGAAVLRPYTTLPRSQAPTGPLHGLAEFIDCYFGCFTMRRYGRGAFQPPGYFCFASSSETDGRMMTSSPSFQFTGVATLCFAVSCMESTTRRTSSKLRPVLIG